jgi:Uma2 family endonuclease
MTVGEALRGNGRATIETFRAFVDDRPDWEKWELIDGEIIETPSSSRRHQLLIGSLLFQLETGRRAAEAPWLCFMGIGTRVPGDNRNEILPDVMVMPPTNKVIDWTYDVLAAFEVIGPETAHRDMVKKRNFYARIDSLTHYTVLAQDQRDATMFSRSDGFNPRVLKGADARIEIEPLGVSIALGDIYRDVPLD